MYNIIHKLQKHEVKQTKADPHMRKYILCDRISVKSRNRPSQRMVMGYTSPKRFKTPTWSRCAGVSTATPGRHIPTHLASLHLCPKCPEGWALAALKQERAGLELTAFPLPTHRRKKSSDQRYVFGLWRGIIIASIS